jgi:hypothetical protein
LPGGVQTGFVAALCAVALAACGGGGTDRGGFTSGDRKAAESVLALLAQTAVYTSAVKTSYTQGFPPTACVVHIEKRRPLTFKVFMSWVPQLTPGEAQGRTYAWLEAVIGPQGLKQDYSFRTGNEATEAALKTRYKDAFAKPVEKCLVLQNQRFALLSSAGPRRAG